MSIGENGCVDPHGQHKKYVYGGAFGEAVVDDTPDMCMNALYSRICPTSRLLMRLKMAQSPVTIERVQNPYLEPRSGRSLTGTMCWIFPI